MYPEEQGYKALDDVVIKLKGLLKSKTAWGLTSVMPTVLLAIKGLGFTLTPEITAGVYIVGGLIYRWITRKPLEKK